MSYERRFTEALTIVGIATRASNADPQKIGDLWRRFHALGDRRTVEARLDETVY